MEQINSLLSQLILQNNCVIIPQLGGFISNYFPAKIDTQNRAISPPFKAINFNRNLQSNDGLLIQKLAEKEQIQYEKAQQIIHHEVLFIKSKLDKNERLHFQNVGYLYLNNSGKITFEQDRFSNLLLSSYGLKTIHLATIQEEHKTITPLQATHIDQLERSEAKKSRFSFVKQISKYAAILLLLPILFYSFWIPLKTDALTSGVIYVQDFNPFTTINTTEYQFEKSNLDLSIEKNTEKDDLFNITSNLSDSISVFNYPFDEDLFVFVKNDNFVRHGYEVSTKISAIHQQNYHIIVGCFESSKNAQKLIQELNHQGFNAYEVDVKGGLHRIAAGNAPQLDETVIIREQLSKLGHPSWILRK